LERHWAAQILQFMLRTRTLPLPFLLARETFRVRQRRLGIDVSIDEPAALSACSGKA